ncbi:hypothetical protein EDD15DRAFT_1368759 [Pisolithus albus]|nr:hypothetical protein EDD15DRAFT_1368759 [Pisolithus albus]
MARIRSRKFRMRRSSSLVSVPQRSSHALSGDANRTAEASGHGYMRNMTAAIKRYFRRSRRNPPSSSANIGTPSGAQQHAEPEPPQVVPADDSQVLARQEEPDPDPASAAADVDAARRAFDTIKPVSSTGQVAVKLVAQADTRVINAQSLSDTYLKPLKVFNTAVIGFAEVRTPLSSTSRSDTCVQADYHTS